jgi:sec-independent protein translocase protein TatC
MAVLKTQLPADTEESQVRMGFGEHLEDFRRRLIYSLLGSGFGIAFCLYYVGNIISFLVRPYIVALKSLGLSPTFGVSGPAEVLMMYLSVGIKAGLVVSSPWIIYQLWLFVAAGLYARERRIVYRYIFPSVMLFLSGICFFFFLILPLSLHFFIAYSQNTLIGPARPNAVETKLFNLPAADPNIEKLPDGDHVVFPLIPKVKADPTKFPDDRVAMWYNVLDEELKAHIGNQTVTFIQHQENSLFTHLPKLGEYLEFVLWACLLFGASFELPMIMLVLAQIGIVDAAGFRKVRKFAYFGIAVFSAIAAPTTDVLTMMCLALPLVALYEVGIVLAAIAGRKKIKEGEDAEKAKD